MPTTYDQLERDYQTCRLALSTSEQRIRELEAKLDERDRDIARVAKTILERGAKCEAMRDKLQDIVDRYSDRFEGNGPGKLFGPIDEEIIAARAVLAQHKD